MEYRISGDWLEVWVDKKCVGAFSKDDFPNMILDMVKVLKDDG